MHVCGMSQTAEVRVAEAADHPLGPVLTNPGLQEWGL